MKTKNKNLILAIIVSVVAIFVPSFLLNKWIEGAIFFFCHWIIREQFKKQYHHIIPAMCRLITATVLFFGITFVLPTSLSLLSAIPINYFIGWVGYTKKQADFYEIKYINLKEKLEQNKDFNVNTCTKEQLITRCQELHLSKEQTELAIKFFIDKTKHSIIAEALCIEEKSVTRKKIRLKEKLNKK